jgi:hypothetical protein
LAFSAYHEVEVGMSKLAFRVVVLGAVIGLLGIASFALAGGGKNHLRGVMTGYQENPDISSAAKGTFKVEIEKGDTQISYELTYSGLESDVRQAHIHFGKAGVNGGISLWLCGTATNPGPAGTQTCPQSGTVTGTLLAANVQAITAQGIGLGEFGEVVAAIRAGHAYANVHTATFGGGEIRAQIGSGRNKGHDEDDKHEDD